MLSCQLVVELIELAVDQRAEYVELSRNLLLSPELPCTRSYPPDSFVIISPCGRRSAE